MAGKYYCELCSEEAIEIEYYLLFFRKLFGDSINNIIPPNKEEMEKIHLELQKILPKEKYEMICLYFALTGKKHTYKQIGKIFNKSAERIRQIIIDALKNIRAADSYAINCFYKKFIWETLPQRIADLKSEISKLTEKIADLKKNKENNILNNPIDSLEFNTRIIIRLEKEGIKTIGDLTRVTKHRLLAIRQLGERSVNLIKNELARIGLSLKTI